MSHEKLTSIKQMDHNVEFDRLKRELGALPYGSDAWRAKLEEVKAFNASDHAQSSRPTKKQRTAGRRRRNRRKTRRSRK